MRPVRARWAIAVVAAAGALVPASLAWACVGLMSLTTASSVVEPGGTVTVTGREFAEGAPVQIHLDSPGGTLLATVPPPTSTMTSLFTVDVVIPPEVEPGEHILFAVQDYHNMNAGAPARAEIYVGSPPAVGPAGAEERARPAQLVVSDGRSLANLVLIGLGVAAGVLFLAGAWSLVVARRPQEAASETVRGS